MSNSLPDFLVIAPQKAGTSWIFEYLLSRGDVCLPIGRKETFFFDRNYKRGLRWYQTHFVPSEQDRWIAEIGPTYFTSVPSPERIKETLGIVPLLCTLRDPAARIFSHYLHMRKYGMTRLSSFHEAIEKYSEILDGSRYATYLKRWFDTFGEETIHIVFLETLATASEEYVRQICNNIGLPEKPIPDRLKQKSNVATLPAYPLLASIGQHTADFIRYIGFYGFIKWGKKKGLKEVFFGKPGAVPIPMLKSEDRQWLIELLLPEIERLECMLDMDLSSWKLINE